MKAMPPRRASLEKVALALAATLLAPSPARASGPLLDGLPLLPAAPPAPDRNEAPAQIPATEKVDGLFVALQPEEMRRENEHAGYHTVFVTTNAAQASAFAKSGNPLPNAATSAGRPTTCLEGMGESWQGTQTIPPRPRPASAPGAKKSARAARPAKAKTPAPAKAQTTHLMRTEMFVVGEGGHATLERREMWVDYVTLGARFVAKTSVPYVRFSTGPQGIELYGAREADGTTVDVVLRTPERPSEVGTFQAEEAGSQTSTSTENGCGILKTSLSLDGGGTVATVMGQLALDGRAPDDTEPEPEPDETAPAETAAPLQVLHMRPLQIAISVSKTASESAPLLSVSYGWTGKDERLETNAPRRRCAHCLPGPRKSFE